MDTAMLASRIDHTLLKPEADGPAVDRLCDEAIQHRFASVCVNGRHVRLAARRVAGSDVKVCAVAGFPLGAMHPAMKAAEAARACDDGADEVDFVAALPALMNRDMHELIAEWKPLADAARRSNGRVTLKVILETAALIDGVNDDEADQRIATACEAARHCGLHFVKTSTGFHPRGGATVEAVKLLAQHAHGLKVKASGGIRTREDAEAMIQAGADRLGCSSGVAIVSGARGAGSY